MSYNKTNIEFSKQIKWDSPFRLVFISHFVEKDSQVHEVIAGSRYYHERDATEFRKKSPQTLKRYKGSHTVGIL